MAIAGCNLANDVCDGKPIFEGGSDVKWESDYSFLILFGCIQNEIPVLGMTCMESSHK